MGIESILKTYDKSKYTKVTAECKLEGFDNFALSAESVVDINKIQMSHHCPEIKITILGAGEKDIFTAMDDQQFPRIFIMGDSVPKYYKNSRRYDKPFYITIASKPYSSSDGYLHIMYIEATIESDVKLATAAFEKIVHCLISDCIAAGIIDTAHREDAKLALDKKIEYTKKGTLPKC